VITNNDECSGSGSYIGSNKEASIVLVGHIKPEYRPTERRHHQVSYHNGDSNWTAVAPSPSSKSKLELNAGFLSFYPTNEFAKNCWFESNHSSWLSFSKLQSIWS